MELKYTQDDIDAFARGQLSPEERAVFVQKMKENPTLADAVAEARFVLDVSIELRKRQLRDSMATWDTEKKTPPPSSPPPSSPPPPEPAPMPSGSHTWWIATAAVGALLVGAYFWFEKPEQPTDKQQPGTDQAAETLGDTSLYIPPTIPPPDTPVPPPQLSPRLLADNNVMSGLRKQENASGQRGDSSSTAALLEKANQLLDRKQYSAARNILQDVLQSDEDFWTAQMYLGDAFFMEKKYAEAEAAYFAVQQQGPAYAGDLFWRLSIIYSATRRCDALEKHLNSRSTGFSKVEEGWAASLRKACR